MPGQITGFPLGLATLGLTGALGLGVTACGGPNMNGRDGGDASRIDSGRSLQDALQPDALADAGRCPMTSLNPPAALRFRAYDVRYGGTGTTVAQATSPFGGVYVNSDLILPVTTGSTPDASASNDASFATGPTNNFVGLFQLGSMPYELPAADERIRRRLNGDPLAQLSRPGLSNWDEAFPGVQNIGLAYTVQGRIDPNACTLNLIVLGAVNAASGLQTNQPFVALPFYSQRPDGRYDMAAPDFGNEAIAVFLGSLNLNLSLRPVPGSQMMESAVLVVCDNNCATINGSSLRRLEVVLTARPQNPAPADAGVDASADSGTDASDAFDAATDAARDAAPESGADAGPDSGIRLDSGTDGSADARPDASNDARG